MNNHLKPSRSQLKVKKLIIGELANGKTFLLTPPWLEGWEAEEDLAGLLPYIAKELKGKIDESIENKTGR